MTRCPLCRSALVTITFGLYPIAICTSCSARWIKTATSSERSTRSKNPTLFASASTRSADPAQLAAPARLTAAASLEDSPW